MDSRRSSASHMHWKLNWWDLWSSVDGGKRPVQWTNESLILSPHPSMPAVVGRVFPSKDSFILPNPNEMMNSPTRYLSPSIIEASPETDNIFAYFPGDEGPGHSVIWKREGALNTWRSESSWPVNIGQGVVFAKWLNPQREWKRGNPPIRAPPLGPIHPFAHPGLVIVTESHMVQFVNRPAHSAPLQMIWASLRHSSRMTVNERFPIPSMSNGAGGLSVCIKGSLGVLYNESSLLIAMHSTLEPPEIPEFNNQFGEIPGPSIPSISSTSPWETFGSELSIQLCEVKITYNNCHLGIMTNPLPPIFPKIGSSARLTDINIIPHLPEDGALSGRMGSPPIETTSPSMMMVLSYLDTEDYLAPKSELMCFELFRNNKSSPGESNKTVDWTHRHLSTCSITDSAVSFIIPSRKPGPATIFMGLLELEGTISRYSEGENNTRQVRVGKVVHTLLPDFREDESYEHALLMSSADDAGVHLPLSAVASPNEVFLCSSPSAWTYLPKLEIHVLPRPKRTLDMFLVEFVAEELHISMLSRRTVSDIVHILSNPNVPLQTVTSVMETCANAVVERSSISKDWNLPLVKMVSEVYRARVNRLSPASESQESEKKALYERHHVSMDIISVHVFRTAFDASKLEEGYDLDYIWNLIALSTWLVDFIEKLLRDGVLWDNQKPPPGHNGKERDPKVKQEVIDVDDPNAFAPKVDYSSETPSLVHLLLPFARDNLIVSISHLNSFRSFLGTLKASQLRSEIAKEVLVDSVDNSGINFTELEAQLRKATQFEEITTFDEGLLRRCLCLMNPLPPTHEGLSKAVELITSPSTISKPRLFIKPSDLIDGISRLNLKSAKATKERDIVSKGALGPLQETKRCSQCNARTDTGRLRLPSGKRGSEELLNFSNWVMWEHLWCRRCVCGGSWVKELPPPQQQ